VRAAAETRGQSSFKYFIGGTFPGSSYKRRSQVPRRWSSSSSNINRRLRAIKRATGFLRGQLRFVRLRSLAAIEFQCNALASYGCAHGKIRQPGDRGAQARQRPRCRGERSLDLASEILSCVGISACSAATRTSKAPRRNVATFARRANTSCGSRHRRRRHLPHRPLPSFAQQLFRQPA
jgi:hypothetical protein